MIEVCDTCKGRGECVYNPTGRASFNHLRTCPHCQGKGWWIPREVIEAGAKALYEARASFMELKRDPWPVVVRRVRDELMAQASLVIEAAYEASLEESV